MKQKGSAIDIWMKTCSIRFGVCWLGSWYPLRVRPCKQIFIFKLLWQAASIAVFGKIHYDPGWVPICLSEEAESAYESALFWSCGFCPCVSILWEQSLEKRQDPGVHVIRDVFCWHWSTRASYGSMWQDEWDGGETNIYTDAALTHATWSQNKQQQQQNLEPSSVFKPQIL